MAKGMRELLSAARARIKEIDTGDAARILARKDETLFLDVREPDEFAEGHIPGAHLLPRGLLEPRAAADSPSRDPELHDTARPIVVYCGSGARSALAALTLGELGFTNVVSMAGGMLVWKRESRRIAL